MLNISTPLLTPVFGSLYSVLNIFMFAYKLEFVVRAFIFLVFVHLHKYVIFTKITLPHQGST